MRACIRLCNRIKLHQRWEVIQWHIRWTRMVEAEEAMVRVVVAVWLKNRLKVKWKFVITATVAAAARCHRPHLRSTAFWHQNRPTSNSNAVQNRTVVLRVIHRRSAPPPVQFDRQGYQLCCIQDYIYHIWRPLLPPALVHRQIFSVSTVCAHIELWVDRISWERSCIFDLHWTFSRIWFRGKRIYGSLPQNVFIIDSTSPRQFFTTIKKFKNSIFIPFKYLLFSPSPLKVRSLISFIYCDVTNIDATWNEVKKMWIHFSH